MNRGTIEKSPLPGHGEELCVLFRRRVTGQPYPGFGIKERLAQAF